MTGAPAAGVLDAYGHLLLDARTVLEQWNPPDLEQDRLRTAYLQHLADHPDAVAKSGPPAHLTASCLVLSTDASAALLTHHRRARQWFQFGGHLEPGDATVRDAATREGREESGIEAVTARPVVVQLDRHRLDGDFGHCREHLDIRYAALLDRSVLPVPSAESIDVAWWPTSALPPGTRTEIDALVRAARRALGL